jgi:hypothetical protein
MSINKYESKTGGENDFLSLLVLDSFKRLKVIAMSLVFMVFLCLLFSTTEMKISRFFKGRCLISI